MFKISSKNIRNYLYLQILLIFFLIFFFSLSILLSAQEDIESILNSKPEGYVADFANVIPLQDEQQIHLLCSIIDNNSQNQVAVVTVNSLGLYSIEEFSYKLLEKWGIGKKESNNGILVLLALNEKKVRIEVGYGLEPIIPDSKAALIIQNYGIPYFKESNFGKGLYNMVYALGETMAKDRGQDFSDWVKEGGLKPKSNNEGAGFFIFVLILIIIFILNVLFRKPRFYGYRNRSVANQLFNAYLASTLMRNTFFGNNISSTKNSGFGGFKGGGFGGFGGFGGGSSGGGGATGGW